MIRALLLSSTIALAPLASHASDLCSDDAMIVFDGSGSMAELDFNITGDPRIIDARKAINRAVPKIAKQRNLGLLIYGPGELDGCSNIDLRFAPASNAAPRIIEDVQSLTPGGMTPLTASVERAAQVLGYRAKPGTIVLVTDGKETCGGAPCQLGAALARDAHDLTIHVIGFKIRGDFFSWNSPEQKSFDRETTVAECLATQTGGRYVSTETVDELVAALQDTLGCALIGRAETHDFRSEI
jgi:Ca-activated chloride channel family protein